MSINYVFTCDKNNLINVLLKKISKISKDLNIIKKEISEYINTLGKNIKTEIKIYDFYFIKVIHITLSSNGKIILFDYIVKNKKIYLFNEKNSSNGFDLNYIEDDLKYKDISTYSIFSFSEILFLHYEDCLYGYIKIENSNIYISTDKENFSLSEIDFEGNLLKSKKFKFKNIEKVEHLIIYLCNYLKIKDEFLNKLDELGLAKINKEFFKINELINY